MTLKYATKGLTRTIAILAAVSALGSASAAPLEPGKIPAVPVSQNPEAQNLYAQGEALLAKSDPRTGGTFANARAAIDLYQRAAALDPNLARAYVQIARAWNVQGYSNPDAPPPDVINANVSKAVQAALRIDPNLPEAHALLASIYYLTEYDWPRAEREYRWSINHDPKNAQPHSGLAQLLATLGRFDESMKEARLAQSLRHSAIDDLILARIYYSARNYDAAVENCRRALAAQENQAFRFYLGLMLLAQGKNAEGVKELETAANQPNDNAGAKLGLAYGYALTGRGGDALALIKAVEKTHSEDQIPAYRRAAVYLALGQREQALQDLRKEYQSKGNWIVQVKVDPVMDPLRQDPAFKSILKRMRLV